MMEARRRAAREGRSVVLNGNAPSNHPTPSRTQQGGAIANTIIAARSRHHPAAGDRPLLDWVGSDRAAEQPASERAALPSRLHGGAQTLRLRDSMWVSLMQS